jgi:hypothetical protein
LINRILEWDNQDLSFGDFIGLAFVTALMKMVAPPRPFGLLDLREGTLTRYRDSCQYTLAKFVGDTFTRLLSWLGIV